MVKRRVFDEAFREMAVELSYAKESIKEAARESGINPGRIWNLLAEEEGRLLAHVLGRLLITVHQIGSTAYSIRP